jgi:hypothetical protein
MEAICDISFKVWLTGEEAELYTGYGRDILRKARDEGNLTFYQKKDTKRTSIRYRREDLDNFMLREHEPHKAYDELPFIKKKSIIKKL